MSFREEIEQKMKSRRGLAGKRKGYKREYELMKKLQNTSGCLAAVRSAKSAGPFDVIAIFLGVIELWQVKSRRPSLKEIQDLTELAKSTRLEEVDFLVLWKNQTKSQVWVYVKEEKIFWFKGEGWYVWYENGELIPDPEKVQFRERKADGNSNSKKGKRRSKSSRRSS